MPEPWREAGFGIYIHWPFCAAKCPYCDFNSHVSRSIDQARWKDAYLFEIDRFAERTEGRVVSTVFFGGGTPSLMDPDLVDAILGRIRARWPQSNDVEITLEANPTSVESTRFRAYSDAGVNRLSLGIQALKDHDLKRLGRLHSAAEAMAAFEIARDVFARVSFDLIYARQDQSLQEWEAELSNALSMAADHVSLYQLTIEDGTAFGARYREGGLKGLPDEDLAADMFALTQDLTAASGLPAYEISNHSRPGGEARHNLIYWRGGDYVGIGPGAHGRLTFDGKRVATETPLSPETWLSAVESGQTKDFLEYGLTFEDVQTEYLMMSLRLVEGADQGRLQISETLSSKINSLIEDGLLAHTQHGFALTPRGRPVLNAVLRALLT